jgi:hypothetical protein
MNVYLYTELGYVQADGPFRSVTAATRSPLWEVPGVSVWIERKVRGGWRYENVRFTSQRGWVTSSRGLRPALLIRPERLDEAWRAAA